MSDLRFEACDTYKGSDCGSDMGLTCRCAFASDVAKQERERIIALLDEQCSMNCMGDPSKPFPQRCYCGFGEAADMLREEDTEGEFEA